MTNRRHRTTFPGGGDFGGYWVRSSVYGTLAQLVPQGRNIHTDHTYSLLFTSGQLGDGLWTTEELLEKGATITRDKPEEKTA
jgi:hypothetical protein